MVVNYLTNKEDSTVLDSVVKHAGSGRAQKKCRGKHEMFSRVSPLLECIQKKFKLAAYLHLKYCNTLFSQTVTMSGCQHRVKSTQT